MLYTRDFHFRIAFNNIKSILYKILLKIISRTHICCTCRQNSFSSLYVSRLSFRKEICFIETWHSIQPWTNCIPHDIPDPGTSFKKRRKTWLLKSRRKRQKQIEREIKRKYSMNKQTLLLLLVNDHQPTCQTRRRLRYMSRLRYTSRLLIKPLAQWEK